MNIEGSRIPENQAARVLESSQFSELDGASVDNLDAKIETFDSLISNEEQVTPNMESCTTKLGTRRSYQLDVGNAPALIGTPALKVSEDKYKTRDEDARFFESLIPHIKGLSPARKNAALHEDPGMNL
jgi:hypothetical protein